MYYAGCLRTGRIKLTIEEISEMVGYNSKTAINNAFKRLTGKTPSEFRKLINS